MVRRNDIGRQCGFVLPQSRREKARQRINAAGHKFRAALSSEYCKRPKQRARRSERRTLFQSLHFLYPARATRENDPGLQVYLLPLLVCKVSYGRPGRVCLV